MATVLRMPEVIASAEEAVLARWVVNQGDSFVVGDVLAEIETEKALVELLAESGGVLRETLVGPGTTVLVGDPIAVIAAPGESKDTVLEVVCDISDFATAAPSDSPVTDERRGEESNTPVGRPDVARSPLRRFASPLARRLARDGGLDISTIHGTGPGDRVIRRDVERAIALLPAEGLRVESESKVMASTGAANDEYEVIPLTPIRLATARRLAESKSSVPHFYVRGECVVDDLIALRSQYIATAKTRVSLNDLFVKAVALTHVKVPEANVTWAEKELRQHLHSDIGIAITIPEGLVTPVVRRANELAVAEIAVVTADLIDRARRRRLKQSELEGGSFTVTNLGMYGTLEFSAILNPPQSGILAVGAIRSAAVVVDGRVKVSSVVVCTLSVDHRCVDGAVAAQWMAAFVDTVERPLQLFT